MLFSVIFLIHVIHYFSATLELAKMYLQNGRNPKITSKAKEEFDSKMEIDLDDDLENLGDLTDLGDLEGLKDPRKLKDPRNLEDLRNLESPQENSKNCSRKKYKYKNIKFGVQEKIIKKKLKKDIKPKKEKKPIPEIDPFYLDILTRNLDESFTLVSFKIGLNNFQFLYRKTKHYF